MNTIEDGMGFSGLVAGPDDELMQDMVITIDKQRAEISRLHEELCICKGMRMVAETRLAKANAFLESQKLGNVLKEAAK